MRKVNRFSKRVLNHLFDFIVSVEDEISGMNHGLRILCVEDNAPLKDALKRGLIHYGFEVITASHGIEALVQYNAHNGLFGAVVTDHDMPQMNGLELVQSVRRLGYSGRVVVTSGDLRVSDLVAYHDLEISGFFRKPFEISMLAYKLLQKDRP